MVVTRASKTKDPFAQEKKAIAQKHFSHEKEPVVTKILTRKSSKINFPKLAIPNAPVKPSMASASSHASSASDLAGILDSEEYAMPQPESVSEIPPIAANEVTAEELIMNQPNIGHAYTQLQYPQTVTGELPSPCQVECQRSETRSEKGKIKKKEIENKEGKTKKRG